MTSPTAAVSAPTGISLPRDVAASLRAQLPDVAARTVAALVAQVPEYSDPLRGEMGAVISRAVELALSTFLHLAEEAPSDEPGRRLLPALEAAYALGRGEARSGRTMTALLAAYRVGARASWEQWGTLALQAGLPPERLVPFAALVFAYIDQLSAASVSGHSEELATTGRVREQYRERLCVALLTGASAEDLERRAERADWQVPRTLTCIIAAAAHSGTIRAQLGSGVLSVAADAVEAGSLGFGAAGVGSAGPGGAGFGGAGPGGGDPRSAGLGSATAGTAVPPPAGRAAAGTAAAASSRSATIHLVPDVGPRRAALLGRLADLAWVLGPERPWTEASASYRRAARTLARTGPASVITDTEAHLAELVLSADAAAQADLRARVLAPLSGLRPDTAERLAQTLRSWLLHLGRREDVARDLVVHPQTVRYRMGQIRELFGDRLDNPATVRDLVVALGLD